MTRRFYQPDIRPIARRRYRLKALYQIVTRVGNVIVPAGFEHDGASIPRLAWALSGLTPDGLIRAAALVHDFLYRFAAAGERAVTRAEADLVFYDLMREAGLSRYRAGVAYYGVRAGGWVSWRKHRRAA